MYRGTQFSIVAGVDMPLEEGAKLNEIGVVRWLPATNLICDGVQVASRARDACVWEAEDATVAWFGALEQPTPPLATPSFTSSRSHIL